MSFTETLVILVVAMIVLGPKKLPQAARKVGHWMGVLRRASDEFKRQVMTMDQQFDDRLNVATSDLDRLAPTDEELARQVNDTLDEVEAAFGAPPVASPDDDWGAEPVPGGLPPEPAPAPEPPPAPAASVPDGARPRSLGLSPTPKSLAKEARRG